MGLSRLLRGQPNRHRWTSFIHISLCGAFYDNSRKRLSFKNEHEGIVTSSLTDSEIHSKPDHEDLINEEISTPNIRMKKVYLCLRSASPLHLINMNDEESFPSAVRGISSVIASSRRYRQWALPIPPLLEYPAGPRYQTGRPLLMCPPKDYDHHVTEEPLIRERVDECLDNIGPMEYTFRAVMFFSSAVGKSMLAIQCAVSRSLRKGVNIILWVDCSTKWSIRRSFGSIAEKLELPSYDVRDHDRNRDIVLDWLETTGWWS